MLRTVVTLALLAAALYAQDKPAEAPPAKVDQALRARVNRFYQDFVKGQFTDAETMVAQESRNVFAATRKEQYLSCEVTGAKYFEKFKLAQVAAVCERNIMFPGFVGHPLKTPISSAWKLEHGKWYWYVDPNAQQVTPFGTVGNLPGAAVPASPLSTSVAIPPPSELNSAAVALHKVSADRQSLALKAGESAAITFSNSALGPMGVSLAGGAPQGIEVTPTQADLPRDGKATLTVKALAGAKPAVLNFQVFPTGEFIAVKVDVQ